MMFHDTKYASILFGISLILVVTSLYTKNRRDMIVSLILFGLSLAWFLIDLFAGGPIS